MKALFAALLVLCTAGQALPQSSDARCTAKVESLINVETINGLAPAERSKVLHALADDMVEMGKQDIARTDRSVAAYSRYFARWLEFATVPGGQPGERLLLVRYDSHTVCGAYENCPTWIVGLTRSGARSLVPWRPSMGTSATGAWGVAIQQQPRNSYPELMLLTHLDAYQTAVACYRNNGKNYIAVKCSPQCAHFLDKPRK